MAKATQKSVAEAWSESIGREVEFEFETVEAVDGRKQVELRNKQTGGLVAVANGSGAEAYERLRDNAGIPFLDTPFTLQEREGLNQANQVNKSDKQVPTPSTMPGAAEEAEKPKDADKLAEDKE